MLDLGIGDTAKLCIGIAMTALMATKALLIIPTQTKTDVGHKLPLAKINARKTNCKLTKRVDLSFGDMRNLRIVDK